MLKNYLEEIRYRFFKFIYGKNKDSCIRFEETKFNRIDLLKYIQDKIQRNNENFS